VNVSVVKGYDGGITIGQRKIFLFSGTGPTSYTQGASGGDVLSLPYGLKIDFVEVCMSVSRTYVLVPFPTVVGTTRAVWAFSWRAASNFAEVAGATNLSAESVQFIAYGGDF
jgi:hypothetical protein